jgi:catechol 2,3-dioxygenase-like lactoylglutathione lyase family enzyme
MPPQLNIIGIVVDDMARALAFYRELGLDVPADADDQPHVHAELPNGMFVAWDTVETIRSFDPEWAPPERAGRVTLAFRCDSPADVDATYARITGLGYEGHKEPWDAFWGMRYALVRDPDGNGVDLFSPSA